MSFCRGFKATDAPALEEAKIDRQLLMRTVTEAFAYQVRAYLWGSYEKFPTRLRNHSLPLPRAREQGKRARASRSLLAR